MLSILRLSRWSLRLTELVLYHIAFNSTSTLRPRQRALILEPKAYASPRAIMRRRALGSRLQCS